MKGILEGRNNTVLVHQNRQGRQKGCHSIQNGIKLSQGIRVHRDQHPRVGKEKDVNNSGLNLTNNMPHGAPPRQETEGRNCANQPGQPGGTVILL